MGDVIRTRKIIILAILIMAVYSTFLFSRIFLQRITDEDIPEIVRLTLERALVDGKIPAYEMIKDNESIVLSTENIDLSLIPKLPGVNFTLLSRDEIQEKADREGDFLYLRFHQLKIEDFKVLISLDNTWAVSKDSKVLYLCGGGFTIEYTKDFFGRLHSRALCFWTA